MEAQQCVELTSTNRSFGLIIKLSQTVFERVVKTSNALFFLSIVRLRPQVLFLQTLETKSSNLYASQILLFVAPHFFRRRCQISAYCSLNSRHQVSGDHTARVTPVPIPNTEVKPRRADGTARVTVWERRSSPGLN